MGAESTLHITRKTAKKAILDRIIDGITDEELEDILDRLLLNRNLYNSRIVYDEFEGNDDHIVSGLIK